MNCLGLIGIDIGTKYIKIGLVQPGKNFEIVLNEASKRKTETIISFNTLRIEETDEAEVETATEAGKGDESHIEQLKSIERLFSNDAAGLYTKKPAFAYHNLNSLLVPHLNATDFNENAMMQYGTSYHVTKENATTVPMIEFDNGYYKTQFSAEELMAMILQRVKTLSEDHASQDLPADDQVRITDCVIAVPSSYSYSQRRAVMNAAQIAGLNVLSLINENSAAALNYAVYKNFDELVVPENDTEDASKEGSVKSNEVVLFFNMGHKYTQLSLVEFTARNNTAAAKSYIKKADKKVNAIPHVKMLAHYVLEDVGGGAFEMCLKNKLLADFLTAHYPEEPLYSEMMQDERVNARLLKKANKVKEILSANERIPVTVESLKDDRDLVTRVSRGVIQRCELFAQGNTYSIETVIGEAVQTLLQKTDVSLHEVDAVELIGGSVRIPLVKKTLETYFQTPPPVSQNTKGSTFKAVEVGQHLNGDEAVALGSVFLAANMSKTFRVKRIEFTDISLLKYEVRLTELSAETGESTWEKNALLFDAPSTLNLKKSITFHHDKELKLELSYVDEQQSVRETYATFTTTNIEELVQKHGVKYSSEGEDGQEPQRPKLTFAFRLTSSGVVEVVKADAVFTETIEVKKPKKNTGSNSTEAATDASDSNEEDTTQEEEEEKPMAADETASDDSEVSEEADVEYEVEIQEKKHRFKVSLGTKREENSIAELSTAELRKAKLRLRDLEIVEGERKEKEFIKNHVESTVFASRDKLRSTDGLDEVVSEEELDSVFEFLEAVEDWLYEDEARTATLSVFEEKEMEIKKKVAELMTRYHEFVIREDLIEKTEQVLKQAKETLAQIQSSRPWVVQDYPARVEQFEKVVKAFEAYFRGVVDQQKALQPTEPPVLLSKQIMKALEPVQFYFEQVLKVKKPKPKEEDPAEDTDSSPTDSDKTEESEEGTEPVEGETEQDTSGSEDEEPDKQKDEL